MDQPIRNVQMVSDGILVEFDDSTRCYYPATFLLDQAGEGSNQRFLDYDPSITQRNSIREASLPPVNYAGPGQKIELLD